MDIDFKKFNYNSELRAQRELFKECFPETHDTSKISDEHYLWKFHRKEGDNSSEYGAYSNESLLGYYAAIPYQYRIRNDTIKAAMVCDVMTGVNARGKGLFTNLGIYSTDELSKERYDLSTGFPIRKEVIPGHLRAGWEKYFELPLFCKILNSRSFLKGRKIGFLSPIANIVLNIYSWVLSTLFIKNDKTLKTQIYQSKDLLEIKGLSKFYKDWGNEINISLIKDSKFLDWRLGAPESSYHIVTLSSEKKIVGAIIAKEIFREGVPCLGILDLAALKGYHKYVSNLIREVVKIAKNCKLELLLIMINKTWFNNYKLSLNSFFRTPYNFYFIVKKFNNKLNDEFAKNEENWHLLWIDSDDL